MAPKPTAIVVPAVPAEVQSNVASVETLLSQAVANNVPIETMERLLAMRDRMLAERAKAAFVQAITQFQAECPVIEKTKKVLNKNATTVRYMYAPMDSIITQIKEPLGRAQLSYRFETVQEKDVKEIKAICHITHVLGHTESSYFSVPIGSTEFMTSPQAFASALTFAKRYALLNALGISTGDEDTDATDVKKEPEAKSDKSKIIFLLKSLGKDINTKDGKIDAKKVEKAVLDTVHFKLEDKNFKQIVEHLEIEVRNKNGDIATIE